MRSENDKKQWKFCPVFRPLSCPARGRIKLSMI